jgi:NAD+ synthetase
MSAKDPSTALIVVDVQRDFCPGGALGVAGGDQLAAAIRAAAAGAGTLVASRDMHPSDHSSFREHGGPWPPHCVIGTPGAELHPSVADMPFDLVQDKGSDPAREQYSGFDGTPLADRLRERGVERVLVTGIATDYCVRATALDAIREGFDTTVLTDAVAAVDVIPGDGRRALEEVLDAGGHLDRVHLMRGEEQLGDLLDRKIARLREVVEMAGRRRAVIGLSGGIDSSVAMAIAARALGPGNVTAVRLPSRHTEQVHLDDAKACADAAGLPDENLITISIEPVLEGIAAVRPGLPDAPLRFGNASARSRMILLYDIAQELDALVIGTENRSENLLGYFTRFGDAASDVEPITDLYKTEVRLAARLLGQPEAVITKHPTAGLWGGQTDEDELGFSYEDADRVLAALYDLGMTPEQAAERTGVDPEVVERVKRRVESVAWKQVVPHTLS